MKANKNPLWLTKLLEQASAKYSDLSLEKEIISNSNSDDNSKFNKITIVRNKAKQILLNSIEHLHNNQISINNQAKNNFKAQECLIEALNNLDNLHNIYEDHLANLSDDYQQDIEAILESYKEEKDLFIQQIRKVAVNFVSPSSSEPEK